MTLPPHIANQAFCNISALEAGLIDLPDDMFVANAIPGSVTTAPTLSFLIQHSRTGKKLVFDLGLRKDWENYPPVTVERIKKTYAISIIQDVIESLGKGGTSPADIDYVCLSHCHWDHTGYTRSFTNSTFLVGNDSKTLFQPGYPENPEARYASDLLPKGRTEFLDSIVWEPIGPFPHALDFFGDGSLYIVDAPGHLAGHVNILARTSQDGGWIYLAGDSAHHWSLITLEAEIAVGHPSSSFSCAHQDKEAAEGHIRRIHDLWKLPRVQIILAHDEPWYSKNKGGSSFWPGKIESL